MSELLTFSEAMDFLGVGSKLQRTGWSDKGMFIFRVPGSTFFVDRPPLLGVFPPGHKITYQSHVDMYTADGTVVPWVASQSDMHASDWQVVE